MKEKEELSEKLRRELHDVKKGSMGIIKLLKNDAKKDENDRKTAVLTAEVKWMREKVKEMEEKINISQHNREQQLQFVRKL